MFFSQVVPAWRASYTALKGSRAAWPHGGIFRPFIFL